MSIRTEPAVCNVRFASDMSKLRLTLTRFTPFGSCTDTQRPMAKTVENANCLEGRIRRLFLKGYRSMSEGNAVNHERMINLAAGRRPEK